MLNKKLTENGVRKINGGFRFAGYAGSDIRRYVFR